jgi:flagellar motor component MotA
MDMLQAIGYLIFAIALIGGIIYQTINYKDNNHQ